MWILFKAYVPSTLGLHKLQMQQKMNLGARILKIKPLVKLTKLRYICPTPFQFSFRFEGSKLRYICLNLLMDLFCLLCLTLVYPFVRVLIFHNFFLKKKWKFHSLVFVDFQYATWIKIRKYFLIWWLLTLLYMTRYRNKEVDMCCNFHSHCSTRDCFLHIVLFTQTESSCKSRCVYIYIYKIFKFTNSWLLIWYMQIMIFYGNLNRERWNKWWKWISCSIELGPIYQHEWNSKWLEWWSSFQCY